MHFFVYIIYSSKCDKYYIGQTDGLEKRLYEHNHHKGGKFSSTCLPWQLKYHETYDTRIESIRREKEIKDKKSRKYILALINNAERPV